MMQCEMPHKGALLQPFNYLGGQADSFICTIEPLQNLH